MSPPALRTDVHCFRRFPEPSRAPHRPFLRPLLTDVTAESRSSNSRWLSLISWPTWPAPASGFPGPSYFPPSPLLSPPFLLSRSPGELTEFTGVSSFSPPGASVLSWVTELYGLSHSRALCLVGKELSTPPRRPRDPSPVQIGGKGALPGTSGGGSPSPAVAAPLRDALLLGPLEPLAARGPLRAAEARRLPSAAFRGACGVPLVRSAPSSLALPSSVEGSAGCGLSDISKCNNKEQINKSKNLTRPGPVSICTRAGLRARRDNGCWGGMLRIAPAGRLKDSGGIRTEGAPCAHT